MPRSTSAARSSRPGLVDCHTHLVYAGQRAGEFEQRLEGASYEDIARAGGGIRSTVAATRAASDATLVRRSPRERALALMGEGVTTIEIKSGYGLVAPSTRRAACASRAASAASCRSTCARRASSAHALPPEYAGRADDYIDAVCALAAGAARARAWSTPSTRFCERIGFTPAQTRRVFDAARALGLPVKLHAEQLSDQRGAALAAEYGALSCDHLEYAGDDGVAAMARGRHRRRAAARRVLLPARDAAAAGRGAARRRRADRDRDRPQPGHRRRRSRRC